MDMRTTSRMLFVALAATTAVSCAPGARGGDVGDLNAGLQAEAAMCDLRVERAYDEPIDAGVRAGAREVALGTLEPDKGVEILVPCSYGAVTVFRLVAHDDMGEVTRLALRTQALSPQRTTTVVIRPSANRSYARRN